MKKIILYWLVPMGFAAVILFSSGMPASSQDIKPALHLLNIAEALEPVLRLVEFHYYGEVRSVEANGLLPFTEFLIRKLTHFGVYFILAGLIFWAMRRTTSMALRYQLVMSWMLAVHFAIIDELNQGFTPERTAYHMDVMIDAFGALSAMVLISMFVKIRRNRYLK